MPLDNTFIAADTAATTGEISINSNRDGVRISADNLAGAEVVEVQFWCVDEYVNSGEQLTATAPSKILSGPGFYQLAKGVTASACAVCVDFWGRYDA